MKKKCYFVILFLVLAIFLSGCASGGIVTTVTGENDTYSLRDIGPAGGYIFYDKGYYSSDWRYLEASLHLLNGRVKRGAAMEL